MTDAILLEQPTPVLDDQDPGECHHIVDQWAEGNTNLADASIFGIEVTALCGHKFIPTRDPEKLPLCQACKAALEGSK